MRLASYGEGFGHKRSPIPACPTLHKPNSVMYNQTRPVRRDPKSPKRDIIKWSSMRSI